MSKLIHALRPPPVPPRRRSVRLRAGPRARRAGPEDVVDPSGGGGSRHRAAGRRPSSRLEDFAALESRFDERMKAALPDAALRVFWADTLKRAGALRGCARAPDVVRGRVHARVRGLHVREAEGRAAPHDPSRRASRRDVPRARVRREARVEGAGLRDARGVHRARDVRRRGARDAAGDALDAEGRRAVPGRRPRPRLGAARPRRDRGRDARLPGPRAGPRVARDRRPPVREADEGVREGARGHARHDAQGRGPRRRGRRARRPARVAGRRRREGLRARPQPRRAPRAADRAPRRPDGRRHPPRGAVAPDVAGRARPGRGPLGPARERGTESDGAGAPPGGRRARRPLRRSPDAARDGHDLRRPAVLLARAEVPDPGAHVCPASASPSSSCRADATTR